jgi:hypothetical protein
MSEEAETSKMCFVICPIGEEGSEERVRSDKMLKHVIRPVAEAEGYEAVRGDKISVPGDIPTQLVDRLLHAPLVIADLTGRNPNVYYELGLRHAARKPVLLIQQAQDPAPAAFDVASIRVITVDLQELDSVEACKAELRRHIRAVKQNPDDVQSPVSSAVNLSALQSGGALEKSTAEIINILQEVRGVVGEIAAQVRPATGPWFSRPSVNLEVLREALEEASQRRTTTISPELLQALGDGLRSLTPSVDRGPTGPTGLVAPGGMTVNGPEQP